MRLVLPPYAKQLIEARKRGVAVNVHLHAGDRCWDRASLRKPPNVLMLPPNGDFRLYDWRCCRGEAVTLVVWNRPAEFVDAFARHLVSQGGASLVAALGADYSGERVARASMTFYKPPQRARGGLRAA